MNCESSAHRNSGSMTPIADLNVAMATRPPDEAAARTGTAPRRFRALLDAAEQLRNPFTAWRIEPTSGLTFRRTWTLGRMAGDGLGLRDGEADDQDK